MSGEEESWFELHAAERSFAAQHLNEIGARLRMLAEALAHTLALPLDAAAARRIRVYLGDVAPRAHGQGLLVSLGDAHDHQAAEIWSVYRPDAPGAGLERAAIRLLLLATLGVDLAGMPFVWAGLAGLCEQQLGQAPEGRLVSEAVLENGGEQPPKLVTLWNSQATMNDQQEARFALSFLSFLRAFRDAPALRAFISAAAESGPERAAHAVYHTTLERLQIAWWKGVRLSAAPRVGGVASFLRSCLRYLRPYWRQEIAIFAFLLTQLAFQQILPRAEALLIDKSILPRDLHYLLGLAAFLFASVAVALVAGVLRDLLTTRVCESILRSMRERMFDRLQQASHRFYSEIESGDILSRFSADLRSVQQGLSSTLTQGAFLTFGLVLSSIHLLLINWLLALSVFLSLPLFFGTMRVIGPRANRASLDFAEGQAAVSSLLQEDIGAHPVIKAYNLQPTVIRRFADQARQLYRSAVRLFFLNSLLGLTADLLTVFIEVVVLVLGGYFVIRGRLPLGNLVEFLSLLGLIIGPVQSLGYLIQDVQLAAASMGRVEEILSIEPEIRDAPNAVELQPLRESIRFEDVSFSYRGDARQLDRVSLEIRAGQSVAFVGPSGSGKSTVVNLLLRFYDPDRGRIVVDGRDLQSATLQSLRRQIGVVFQENVLLNGSIRENIRFGRESATDAEVEEAAKLAGIHDVVLAMPQGYDTVVGERGSALSGGQRQRLAIARTLLRQPSILVLDEATSALDPQTENAVNKSLAEFGRGRTIVTVTHRLTTAATADRLFVLDRGRLVEQGTHKELLEAGGLYARLREEQGDGGASLRALQVSYLRTVSEFSQLTPETLDHIAALMRPAQVSPGEVVVRSGEEGDRLYLIVSGEMDVLAPGTVGEPRLLATLGPGDYFGEIALLHDVPRTATVRARTSCQLLTLDRETLRGLLEGIAGLRERIEETIAERRAALAAAASSEAVRTL